MEFDPVSYLIGKAAGGGGGGSGGNVLINYFYSQGSVSGNFTITKTINILENGSYFVSTHGYVNNLTVEINDVLQELTFSDSGSWNYWYENELTLNKDDVVKFTFKSRGRSAVSAQVIQII